MGDIGDGYLTYSVKNILRILPGKLYQTFRSLLRILPDKSFVSLQYLKYHHHLLDLKNPRTFNEKLQWYKLFYRNPLMTDLTDKYEVRKYIESKGHGGLLNDLFGVYDDPDAINYSELPKSFVLKATHGCGMNIICKDKENINWEEYRKITAKWLKINYFNYGREWAYKNIRPRLVCEKYLENEEFNELIDYKFYCYAGEPKVLFVCTGRYSDEGVKYNAYDLYWNRIYVNKGKASSNLIIEKPDNLNLMIDIARTLSQGFPFMRVDLYSVKGEITFGELTFYPDNGLNPFTPDEYNYFFGDFLILPAKRKWQTLNI
ncbi:MAG TPA: ATP-grasp fold amidoligase family protein [Smithella sp.]|nr:ATP-grasp fold amidoligase family protein [Smithella sp.]